ncbi:MAG TPA: PQQ-binding-like beta-propeller repeat protein [Candidatus Saccharimonadales bacterium]|nr:PQQ-binding-like beta-propeller repeat protein [Candidatus Saccharimonadales bacterium]
MKLAKLGIVLTGMLLGSSLLAENWPQWRGPFSNGSTSEKNLPAKWSKTENIAWSVPMPGPAASSPIVWGDHVFVSSIDTPTKTLLAMALDRKSGKVLWQQKVGEGIRRDEKSNFASPSPTTDGQKVIFFYGNGDLVAFDFAGKQLWARNIEKDYGAFAFQWTFSSSPVLYGGKLYLQVLQRDVPVHGRGRTDAPIESYLLGMDPATGKTLWKVLRPSAAVAESKESFATPIVYEFNGQKELIIAGGDCLTGNDLQTGKELWRWATWNPNKIGHWRLVPSAAAGDGIILGCAPKGDPIYAVKAGGHGDISNSGLAWSSEQRGPVTSDVPTPLFYQNDFFVLSDVRKAISRVEPKTGKVKWTVSMPGRSKYEASPLGADGKIYCINFGGEVAVLDVEKGEVLQNISMGEPGDNETRSSIAASQGQLFIRTNAKLFCVGAK